MPNKQEADMIYHSSTDTLFYNSQCLFIEFHDVVEMPWFILANLIKNDRTFSEVFKTDIIQDYSKKDMFEWYIYRKHRNIFKSMELQDEALKNMGNVTDEWYNQFLKNCITSTNYFYGVDTTLVFYKSLNILMSDTPGMVKRIIFYTEFKEPGIEFFIENMLTFGNDKSKIEYLYGDFKTIVKELPDDSTYVFSDIEKVNFLKELNKLNMVSILLVNGLRYNYDLNDRNKLKVDLKELSKDNLFKCSFFNNFSEFKAESKYKEIVNRKQDS